MSKIILPALGDGIQKAVVACWHVKEGEHVNADDDVVELVTDKASFHVASTISGTLKSIFIKEGQEAKIGTELAMISPDV
jgi:pyruvate/2-oxoglutarate dehydrogenase complex dihydrolipoamide acyltransferase (E2) component